MQTFLPYIDFKQSAACLDRARLGKQRVETLQLLTGLAGLRKNGWINHPASKMWVGHELTLIQYGVDICNEWTSRGYKDSCKNKILALAHLFPNSSHNPPPWLGNSDFHVSHQSNLIRKLPNHYQPIFGNIRPDLPYIWPRT